MTTEKISTMIMHMIEVNDPHADQSRLEALARKADQIVFRRFGNLLDASRCRISVSPRESGILFAYATKPIEQSQSALLERDIPAIIESLNMSVND